MFKTARGTNEAVPRVEITVSNRTLFRVVVVVVVTLVLIAGLLKVSHAILLLFIAFFLAVALNAPVAAISRLIPGKRRGSRSIATSLSFLLVIILLGAFAAYIIPPLVHQTEKFIAAAPSFVHNANTQHSSLGRFIRNHHLQNYVDTLSQQISHWAKGESGKAFSSITGIANSIFSTLAVLALTFMMLVEGPHWLKVIHGELIPSRNQRTVAQVSKSMYAVVKGYVNGQVLMAFIAAVVISPALFLLHISYPIALMVVIFLAGLIPMIGHTIGAIIITAVALFHSFTAAIVILIVYIVYMQIEAYFLQPKIQANTTNMSPLLVFASIVIGINFSGLFGGLVAIPIAGCVRVLVIEYMHNRNNRLGLPDSIPDDPGMAATKS